MYSTVIIHWVLDSQQSLSRQPHVFPGSHFGTVVHDVLKTPYRVNDTVTVTFQSACPRNNVRTGDTFLAVQKLQEDTGEWTTVHLLPLCASHGLLNVACIHRLQAAASAPALVRSLQVQALSYRTHPVFMFKSLTSLHVQWHAFKLQVSLQLCSLGTWL